MMDIKSKLLLHSDKFGFSGTAKLAPYNAPLPKVDVDIAGIKCTLMTRSTPDFKVTDGAVNVEIDIEMTSESNLGDLLHALGVIRYE